MSETVTTIDYKVEFKLSDGWRDSRRSFTTIEKARKYCTEREKYFGFAGRIIKTTQTVVGIKTTVTKETVKWHDD